MVAIISVSVPLSILSVLGNTKRQNNIHSSDLLHWPYHSYPGCQRLFLHGFQFQSSLYSDPPKKALDQSAIPLIAPHQSLAQLDQLVQILDRTADWLRTTTRGTDATIGRQE